MTSRLQGLIGNKPNVMDTTNKQQITLHPLPVLFAVPPYLPFALTKQQHTSSNTSR